MIRIMEDSSIESQLHHHGLRATMPRTVIMSVLAKSVDHFTIEELWHSVQEIVPEIELSTVYRVVQALIGAGLAGETRLPNGIRVIEGLALSHAHWVCSSCQQIGHFSDSTLESLILTLNVSLRDTGTVKGIQIVAWGLCLQCQERTPKAPPQ
jgi:Fur family peroxide stress response transcriptional regulator